MKKALIATLAMLAIATTFTACGKVTTCDICKEENVRCKSGKIAGEKYYYCSDCKDEFKAYKELADALGA